jgi:hypothetical protein
MLLSKLQYIPCSIPTFRICSSRYSYSTDIAYFDRSLSLSLSLIILLSLFLSFSFSLSFSLSLSLARALVVARQNSNWFTASLFAWLCNHRMALQCGTCTLCSKGATAACSSEPKFCGSCCCRPCGNHGGDKKTTMIGEQPVDKIHCEVIYIYKNILHSVSKKNNPHTFSVIEVSYVVQSHGVAH